MTKLLLLAGLAGCATEALTSTDQDISKSDLGHGATCTDISPHESMCHVCSSVTTHDPDGDHTVTVCSSYYCVGDTCTYRGPYIPESTFDDSLAFWFEAEAGTLAAPFQRQTDYAASAAGAIAASTAGGTATFAFDSPVATSVVAWARVIAPSTSATSLHVQVDHTSVHWVLPVATTWTWVALPGASWTLDAGAHQLVIHGDDPGVRIDRVLLVDDPQFVPVAHTYQAEAAAVVPPMQLGSTGALFNRTGYIWVPNGAGAGGLAQLSLSEPYAGHYAVWGRVQAPTTNDNAFDLDVDFGARTRWNTPVTSSTTWTWARAPGTYAADADTVLELWRVDDGTKLDQIVVTNDPGFTLVEPGEPVLAL